MFLFICLFRYGKGITDRLHTFGTQHNYRRSSANHKSKLTLFFHSLRRLFRITWNKKLRPHMWVNPLRESVTGLTSSILYCFIQHKVQESIISLQHSSRLSTSDKLDVNNLVQVTSQLEKCFLRLAFIRISILMMWGWAAWTRRWSLEP